MMMMTTMIRKLCDDDYDDDNGLKCRVTPRLRRFTLFNFSNYILVELYEETNLRIYGSEYVYCF